VAPSVETGTERQRTLELEKLRAKQEDEKRLREKEEELRILQVVSCFSVNQTSLFIYLFIYLFI